MTPWWLYRQQDKGSRVSIKTSHINYNQAVLTSLFGLMSPPRRGQWETNFFSLTARVWSHSKCPSPIHIFITFNNIYPIQRGNCIPYASRKHK